MKTFIRKLFGRPSTRPARNTSAPIARPRRPRLGCEELGDRLMPSATGSLTNGVLTITTDRYTSTDDLWVDSNGPGCPAYVALTDSYNGTTEWAADQVGKIVVDGRTSPRPIWLTNETAIPTDYYPAPGGGAYYGGPGTNNFYAQDGGNTEFDGGSGTNNFYDATGAWDDFIGGTGDNLLYQVRPWEYVQTPPSGATPGQIFTITQPGNPYSDPASLNAPGMAGGITAAILPGGQDVMLTGPTGGGFELSGSWTDTRTPDGAGDGNSVHTFSSSTPVSLVTGVGNVPLGQAGLTITTQANDVAAPVGAYSGFSLLGGSLPLSQLSADAAGSAFGGLLSGTGLSFSGAGLSWGIALGSSPALSGLNMPLSADIPYLYASVSTVDSASFGSHVSVSNDGYGGAVVFDPADPAVFVQFTDSQVGTFSAGVSLHGAIPYTPTNLPEGVDNPEIYGNVYVSAAGVALGDLPVAVGGSLVLGLNANQDGAMLGLLEQTPGALKTLLGGSTGTAHQSGVTSQPSLSGLEALAARGTAAMNDIQVGLNGSVAMTTEQYGVSLNVDAATGSLFYTPNGDGSRTVAFDVSTVDPFAGTFLDSFAPKYSAEVGGYITTGTSGSGIAAWGFNATAGSTTFGGFSSDRITIEADSTDMTATVEASMRGLMGLGHLDLKGTVDLTTGDFDLTETAELHLWAGVGSIDLNESFDFGYHHGVFNAGVHLDGYLQVGSNSNNVHLEVIGDVSLTASGKSVQIQGHAEVDGGLTVAGVSQNADLLGIDFNNNGFSFQALDKKVSVNWYTPHGLP